MGQRLNREFPWLATSPVWIPTVSGRCLRHVTGGELFLGQLHNYCLIRAIGAFDPGAMAPTGNAWWSW